MKTLAYGLTWALTLLMVLILAGCAPPATREYRERPRYLEEPGLGVPPSYYNYDPTMEHWFTPPYFNPYITGS